MSRDLTQAINLIKSFEGIADGDPCTVNLDPYLCPAGFWTIGYGHLVLDNQGKRIGGKEKELLARAVYPGGITRKEAEDLLMSDIVKFSAGVEALLKVKISDTKFCALLSFAFNVGLTALKNSTLLLLVNSYDFEHAGEQFLRWTKSNGKELAGLRRRREAEDALWSFD